ncbi:MAG: methyltransferase domain-containing protein [Bdellovibrio sp.]|nr:methyltransferase domain-containing protein [Bdellovibrio sp.]
MTITISLTTSNMADLKEAHQLSFEQEINHWWIRTRFLYIDKAIRCLPNNTEAIHALEFGCGTGQNLYYLAQLSPYRARVISAIGIDPKLSNPCSPFLESSKVQLYPSQFDFQVGGQGATLRHASNMSQASSPQASSPQANAQENQYPKDIVKQSQDTNEQTNLLLVMDVLEHIPDDFDALNQWKRYLKPDGIAVITVPAFQLLWSPKDKFLRHLRRYRRREIMTLAKRCGFEVIYCRYIFSWAFPLVFIARKILFRKAKPSASLRPTNFFFNWIFYLAGKLEYLVRADYLLGTSVVAIIKKIE